MSFLIQQIDGVRVGLREIRGKELLIGRGTNAQIRSENPAVALEHAVIREGPNGYEISDRGSITGTYVSGRPTESALLARGDRIAIGDLQMTVQTAEPGKPLFLRLKQLEVKKRFEAPVQKEKATPVPEQAARASSGSVDPRKLDYARAYTLNRKLFNKSAAVLVATLLALLAVGMVTTRGHLQSFSPGSLSVAHAGARLPDGRPLFAGDDCTRCHQPFAGPSDSLCQECHTKVFHQAGKAIVGECSRCHAEHRNLTNLAAVHHAECLGCHRDLSRFGTRIEVAASIRDFETDHPQLTLAFDRGGVRERVPVEAAIDRRLDDRGLRFDHQCHLSGKCGVRPPTADDPRRVEVRLECTSCHSVDAETGSIEPLSYQTACADCHPLTFDNRFPPVPHGLSLEAIAGVIANAYAGNRDLLTKSPEEVARIFSQSSRRPMDIGGATVRNAQRILRVRCEQCHSISGTTVAPVSVSRRWFRGMKSFDHRAHLSKSLETDCTTCHDAARRSERAADVLMPGIAECRTCHRDSGTARTARLGGCITCHFYHYETASTGPGWTSRAQLASTGAIPPAGSPRPPSQTMEGEEPAAEGAPRLLSKLMIGFLLVIVALVLGAVAWARFRRSGAEPPSSAIGHEPAPSPPGPKPPAKPNAQQASDRPPSSAEPPPEPTVAIDLKGASPSPPAGGTVAIQWVGALVGVEGPFKGNKIPIDADGFYIGRDKEMATVVVDDARVSRRHVWIGERDGKILAIDQDSTNGTFLNTVGSASITEVELKEGDILILADNAAAFRFEP